MAKKKQNAKQKPTAKVGKRQARARVGKLETDRSRVATNQLENVIKNLEYAASETTGLAPETQGTSAALIADAKELLQRMTAYWIAVRHAIPAPEREA